MKTEILFIIVFPFEKNKRFYSLATDVEKSNQWYFIPESI